MGKAIEGFALERGHDVVSIITEENLEDFDSESFKSADDMFRVYPQRTKLSNENSNKVIKVTSIEGAYIEGTTVYDHEGNEIGEALVRMKSIHNKSDYSESLEDAEFRFNSKITDLKRLEKYISSESINNMSK